MGHRRVALQQDHRVAQVHFVVFFPSTLHFYSHAQLRATFEELSRMSGKDILSIIDSEMSGDLGKGMETVGMIVVLVLNAQDIVTQ